MHKGSLSTRYISRTLCIRSSLDGSLIYASFLFHFIDLLSHIRIRGESLTKLASMLALSRMTNPAHANQSRRWKNRPSTHPAETNLTHLSLLIWSAHKDIHRFTLSNYNIARSRTFWTLRRLNSRDLVRTGGWNASGLKCLHPVYRGKGFAEQFLKRFGDRRTGVVSFGADDG